MTGRGPSGLTRRAVFGGMLAAPLIARGAAAQSGSGLTVTWGEDDATPRTYDPRVTSSRHEYQVIAQVFDTLIASDGSNSLLPGLATAWDVAPDGKSVTLKLRSDVGFHDGAPFDADSVKFTFDTIADPKTASEGAVTQLGPYAGTELIDAHTVRVNYSQPFGAALASYAEGTLAPVSPTAVKRLGNQGFARAPVGAGPFRFVSWEEGRQVVLERFDKYNWAPGYNANTGPSSVQRVITRFIPDASTRVAALEAGEIDIADATPILDMKRFSDTRGYVFASSNIPSPGRYKYNWMQLNEAKLDALFAEGRAVTDPAKRAAVYAEAQKIIMDSALWFPVHNQVQTIAYRTEKKGYHFARASWVALFYDVTKA